MRRALLSGLTAVALLAAACGSSGSPPSSGSGSNRPETIKVGVIPIVDTAPMHLGAAKGFYREQNLDVQLVTVTGGAEAIAQVVSGKLDFAFTNIVSAVLARSRGIPLKLVSVGNASTGQEGKDFGGIGRGAARGEQREGGQGQVSSAHYRHPPQGLSCVRYARRPARRH